MSLYRFMTSCDRVQVDAHYVERQALYWVRGELGAHDYQRLSKLLSHEEKADGTAQIVEFLLKPGVTDCVAEQVMRVARLWGIIGIEQVATGQRLTLHAQQPLSAADVHAVVRRLGVNPVIHHYVLGIIDTLQPLPTGNRARVVETIPIRALTDVALEALSQERRTSLNLAEMQAVQRYYQTQERDPTDVELETIAQTWSEHCSHKTFRATIQHGDKTIKGLLQTYIRAATEYIDAPFVASAFVDNAGIIDFDDDYQVAFKVETHNHPSAIEPFGGANTGVGGVLRDILGVSAKPIALTDVFCFGPTDVPHSAIPEGTLHPAVIRSGVIAGVQDYGNKTGIPTVNGAVVYDAAYTANPLVFCGCVGLIPKGQHPKNPQVDDRVVVIGGRVGRDGIRGATFSSMGMDAQTGEVAGASVQIGDPIVAKGLIEVVTRARDAALYNAITDCGAGGLSSAVGEMGSTIGVEVELAQVQLKYPGLSPWEIWLSEAQERMVLAVPSHHIASLAALCAVYEIEWANIGVFTGNRSLVVRDSGTVVARLDNEFLFEGMPRRHLMLAPSSPASSSPAEYPCWEGDYTALLLALLHHPNISSKEHIIRRYDHEVQGGTVVKPLTGAVNDGPSDACVLKPQGTKGVRGIVIANGVNPQFGRQDPYRMALSVIDEAVRNAVAVGADPDQICILDNFCFGNPERSETLAGLVATAKGCYDAAVYHKTPFISGKDSLNNEYLDTAGERHAIPGTLLISALGVIPDITQAVTMDFKRAGNYVYMVGQTRPEFGGSHFNLCTGDTRNQMVPTLPEEAAVLYRLLHTAMRQQWVAACHDMSEGGFAVAVAEMCMAGRLGCALEIGEERVTSTLFSESNGRFVVEVAPENQAQWEALFAAKNCSHLIRPIGTVTEMPTLVIKTPAQVSINVTVDKLLSAWQT